MQIKITVLAGDGVGPEVTAEAIKVLEVVGNRFGHDISFQYALLGGIAIDETGSALPEETLEAGRKADAIILGAVGGPKWDDPQAKVRPEDGLLGIRRALGLYANLRPVKVDANLSDGTTLKPEVVADVDLVVVRELTGGLYFGKPKKRWQTSRGRRAVDTLSYSEKEIERILRVGFELAQSRRGKLTSVDKANVLESSRLWRQIATELAPEYSDVELEHVLVDACAMRLIRQPGAFDVIVTENMFGDILTDEASMLAGSMGMLPSASLGTRQRRGRPFGLYEPIHGSAPDIAGQNVANPMAAILSVGMMLRLSFGLDEEADAIEAAVAEALDNGYRTRDIMQDGAKLVGTVEMGSLIAEKVGG
jgi:3-isopropylmalate dehydrogenase